MVPWMVPLVPPPRVLPQLAGAPLVEGGVGATLLLVAPLVARPHAAPPAQAVEEARGVTWGCCLLLTAAGCCWLLLTAGGCCWLLLAAL